MQVINFLDNHKVLKDVIPVFLEAFPEDERPPVFLFKKAVRRKTSELLAYYNNKEFIGFTLLTFHKDLAYMYFFAVTSSWRNQGYGSKIIQELFNRHNNITIFLLREEIDDKYPDNKTRERRKGFYLRNGFLECGYKVNEFGVVYESMYHGNKYVNYEDYYELMRYNVGKIVEGNIKRVA